MRKQYGYLCVVFLLALLLMAACVPVAPGGAPAAEPAGEDTGLLGVIQQRGTLVVGTSADYPPYESIDASGNFVGFDMDLVRAVGEKLGVEVEIQDMPFDTLIAAVQEGKIDAVIAAMQATAERDKMVDFTIPYRMTKDAFLGAADTTLTLEKPEDAAGKSIGAQTGTVQERWIQDTLVGGGLTGADQVFSYERADQGALDVSNGRIELFLLDAEPAISLA
jgi:polar amino acid transport system substrate-binding protein